jgi:hypothetical protein
VSSDPAGRAGHQHRLDVSVFLQIVALHAPTFGVGRYHSIVRIVMLR